MTRTDMQVYTTLEGGSVARFGMPTGKTRVDVGYGFLGGEVEVVRHEIEAFEIRHPDETPPGTGYEVPDWIASVPCAAGMPLGLEWA